MLYLSIAEATLRLDGGDDLQLSKVNLQPITDPFLDHRLRTPSTTVGLGTDSENAIFKS